MNAKNPLDFSPTPIIHTAQDELTYDKVDDKGFPRAYFKNKDGFSGSITLIDDTFILRASFRGKDNEYRKKKIRYPEFEFDSQEKALQYWFDNVHDIWIKQADMSQVF